jgi:hypothetical protein
MDRAEKVKQIKEWLMSGANGVLIINIGDMPLLTVKRNAVEGLVVNCKKPGGFCTCNEIILEELFPKIELFEECTDLVNAELILLATTAN